MIVAEELGVNSNNVSSLRDDSENPEIQRLLGKSGESTSNIGLILIGLITLFPKLENKKVLIEISILSD